MSSAEQNTLIESQELVLDNTSTIQDDKSVQVQDQVQLQVAEQVADQNAGSVTLVPEPVSAVEPVACNEQTTNQNNAQLTEAEHVVPSTESITESNTPSVQPTPVPVDVPTGSEQARDAKVSFDDISLTVVSFNRIFSRNRGTLSQVVKSLTDMHDRLVDPTNDYQKGLYPQIRQECVNVVAAYSQLVGAVEKTDNTVFGYYLNGPQNNGKRRTTTTKHEQKSYGVSEYKETLKSIDDRLRHIKIDCIRKTRDTTRTDQDIFERVITFCDQYHKVITEHLAKWDSFVGDYRRSNGVVVKTQESTDASVKGVQDTKSTERIRGARRERRAFRPRDTINTDASASAPSSTADASVTDSSVKTSGPVVSGRRRSQHRDAQTVPREPREPRVNRTQAALPEQSASVQVQSQVQGQNQGPVIKQEGRVRVQRSQPIPRPNPQNSTQNSNPTSVRAPNSGRVSIRSVQVQAQGHVQDADSNATDHSINRSAQSTHQSGFKSGVQSEPRNGVQGGRRRFNGASVKSVVTQSAVNVNSNGN